MGRPELATDARFSGHAARGQNQKLLDDIIAEWTATLDSRTLLALMQENGIAAGLVYKVEDMLEDPHYQARGSIVSAPHPVFGEVKMQAPAPRLTETPGAVAWPGPALGEHTDEILSRVLGLSGEEIAALRASGVV
jgi:formyl-CoA transferase